MGSARVLIAYGSRAGATADIAAALVDVLRAEGIDPVVADTRDVRDISRYGAVVIVSGTSVARWRREAIKFLGRFSDELSRRAVWMVQSGSAGLPPKVKVLADKARIRQTTTFGATGLAVDGIRAWASQLGHELTSHVKAA